jgi:hypothetical protein
MRQRRASAACCCCSCVPWLRAVSWPTSRRRLNPFKAHLGQIKRTDKDIDHPNRVALVNEIIKAVGQ